MTAEEPIAVVGMAGRFPGAPDTDSLWTLLMGRGDAIGPVPADRWDTDRPLDPEKDVQTVGGFLEGIDRFDAAFFGVSPREAAAIDPQQRLLLEVAWRALEDAGVPAAALAGSRTGVYVGASWHDYELLRINRGARPTPHSLYGNALDVVAARLSYVLKLRGPSLTVETGCSSSLVALHLAAQALRSGEVEAALVGGVNLMADPYVTVGLTHFGGLSPDGRCQAFAASANGFVRGEGVAALCLKTLSRAQADGDRIHGLVVRTVVNNDGGGDSLVTPSPEGQEDLLRQAYGTGAVPVGQPVYVEAHGTGTGRGDPIEATALGTVLGRHRDPANPLHIGSIKTNIGHLEASAGLAGLFKLLLALRHRTVPPSLHSAELNPAIPFEDLNVRVVREPLALDPEGPVHLGLNSFGWGGTNAHVVLASPPAAGPAEPAAAPATGLPAVVPLSARERGVLAERARELLPLVPQDPQGVREFAGTLAWRRDHFQVRAGLVADTPEELRAALETLAADRESEGAGRAVPRGRTAFVFPGQGSQWDGMGQELYRDSPVFAATVTRCAEALRPHTDWDLLEVFAGRAGDEWTTRIDMLQPVLWAMSLGLAELWRANGVEPDVVLGHSQGEITAATLAGILSYEDAALVMARRSAIARRTSGQGRMLAVDLDREGALAALEGFEESISLAVHNGPHSCVLSGEQEAVLTLKELLEAEGTYCRLVNVDYASHSPQMDPLREDLLEALAPTAPRGGAITLMSTVRVRQLDGPEMDAAYWVENLRSPVLFADTMAALLDEGVTHVVEISPHPVLAPAIEQLTADRAEPAAVLTTMRHHQGSPADFARALATAYTAGLEPFGALPRDARLTLPGYPLRQDRYWIDERPRSRAAAPGLEPELTPAPGQPGRRHGALEPSTADLPWLGDHQVHGTPVLPGAAVLGIALATVRARTGHLPKALEQVAFRKGVPLGDTPARLTAEWTDDAEDGGAFRLLALPEGGEQWEESATARAVLRELPWQAPGFPGWGESAEPGAAEELYRTWAARGLEYGPAFRTVGALAVAEDGEQAVGRVALPERLRPANRPYGLHPALWDGALQVSLALCAADGPGDAVVPTGVQRVVVVDELADPVSDLWSHALRRADGLIDVHLFTAEERTPLLSMIGLTLTPLPTADRDGRTDGERLHRIDWIELTDAELTDAELTDTEAKVPAEPGRWVVCGDGPTAEALAEALAARDAKTARIRPDEEIGAADGVVFLAPGAEAGPAAQQQGLLHLAALATACTAQPVPPRLAVVTLGGQAVLAADRPDPGAALYWGFTRVLRREHGELTPRIIDLDPNDEGLAAACAAELLTDPAEADDQLALRPGRRLAARLARGAAAPAELPTPLTRRQPFRIDPDGRPAGIARRAPGPGEIELETAAATLPGRGTGTATGLVGRVVAVGEGVTGLAVGDRAAAVTADGPVSHLTVRVDHAVAVPDTLGDAEAAALPPAVATAHQALVEAARVTAGDTVLVHVTDGTGLAAAALARRLGARVLATVPGGAATGPQLEGVELLDAEDPGWPQAVRSATGGSGADVVLGRPAGATPARALAALAADGRAVALDGLRPGPEELPDGAAQFAVDAAGLLRRRPDRFAAVLAAGWAGAAAAPLPVAPRGLAEAGEGAGAPGATAVLLLGPAAVEAVPAAPLTDGAFRADGSYLITGGLGALGLSLAGYLAEHGAGALVLLGRSAPTPAAEAEIERITALGATVRVVRCDVADAAALGAALETVRAELPPLRGVVHAAGLLDDATVRNLTAEQLDRVLAPKATGARHLDALTTEDPLDLFVLFSSAAALVGNPGQSAYAAANAYLDALAEARRRCGRPALSVQWGPFTDIGLAATDETRGARLAERGMGGIPAEEAWPALVRMLERDRPVAGYVPIDLRQWFDASPDTAALPSWQLLHAAGRAGVATGGEFLARLRAAAPEERTPLAARQIRELAGRVLRLDPERIEPDTPLKALGLDSLMSLELRNRLEGAFGTRLSPTLLWAYGTATALAEYLCAESDGGPARPPRTPTGPDTDRS
ncbi:SDR family NAD(P)-dependent oxidoreductase [Kitasatospora sp. NPDC028055]|uniref:SDR family NAD(P)-dependent oxidoreductase n=1 Tax=Kitasatospora sp. NPDC028055 TaxID=3155653 RepID=UPI0033E8CE51